jgi:hypothetical protein
MLALPLLIALLADAPQAASPCASPEHRQFDFWIGEWEVTLPDGRVAGHNRITPILGGCALREEWTGAKGNQGTSLNAWDADARRWRQTWVDQSGTVLLLAGAFEGGKMVLQSGDGASRQRITWTPMNDGRVRQLWDSSSDGGRTWKVEFDGTYKKQ